MKDLAQYFIANARRTGIQYGDIRVIELKRESITVKNGRVENISNITDIGFGVRVLHQGCWGFAASHSTARAEIERITKLAMEIAVASATAKQKDVIIDDSPPESGTYETKVVKDPFQWSIAEKVNLLFEWDKQMRGVKGLTNATSSMDSFKEKQVFASTEGALIEQTITETGAGIEAVAIKDGEMQRRCYPNSFRGQFHTGGWELIEPYAIGDNAERIASEAVMLLSAPELPHKTTTIIIEGAQLGLQVHESIGHPVELDRVLGSEAAYAGMSFVTLEKQGKLKYGSDILHVTADATLPGGLGSFGYDDDGVKAQRVDIIKDGLFLNYLTNRETAPIVGQRSNGTNRADGWNRAPIIRMTNINLEPGEWEFDDLIADTDEGFYLETNKSWSIDDRRVNFQFGCELAREIKNGKLGQVYKNSNYTGITTEFWGGLDAVCNRNHWVIWGTPNCGKGQPSQTAHVAHGTAPARFRGVEVGVRG
ncbi:TldD/PmbA family protein [bacterium]|nr:TldD/PmbA family protein [bacterium]